MDSTETPTAKRIKLDLGTIDERIHELEVARIPSKYVKQKSQLQSELQLFLHTLDPSKTPLSCSPKDVVRFLVWKDRKGRTKVHKNECEFFGSRTKGPCGCPNRLAAGTVDSIIGKLRAIFNSMDRSGQWDDRLKWGNPASHYSVKQYLKSIEREQAEARISPKQATPVFFDKFLRIVSHLRGLLSDNSSTAIQKYIYTRDLAFFTLQFFTGQRASDLGRLKTADILRNPDGKSLLIHQRIGKSLRGNVSRPFPVRQCKNPAICPVKNLRFYRELCKAMKINLGHGFLFRTTTKEDKVSSSPFLVTAGQARLITYLTSLGINENETIHWFRGGTAILLSLLGASKEDVARHIGWCSTRMVDHYTQVDKVLAADQAADASEKLNNSVLPQGNKTTAKNLGAKFREWNNLVGFKPFFTA